MKGTGSIAAAGSCKTFLGPSAKDQGDSFGLLPCRRCFSAVLVGPGLLGGLSKPREAEPDIFGRLGRGSKSAVHPQATMGEYGKLVFKSYSRLMNAQMYIYEA